MALDCSKAVAADIFIRYLTCFSLSNMTLWQTNFRFGIFHANLYKVSINTCDEKCLQINKAFFGFWMQMERAKLRFPFIQIIFRRNHANIWSLSIWNEVVQRTILRDEYFHNLQILHFNWIITQLYWIIHDLITSSHQNSLFSKWNPYWQKQAIEKPNYNILNSIVFIRTSDHWLLFRILNFMLHCM